MRSCEACSPAAKSVSALIHAGTCGQKAVFSVDIDGLIDVVYFYVFRSPHPDHNEISFGACPTD